MNAKLTKPFSRRMEDIAAFARSVPRSFTRENLMSNLKTLLTVIPLTILVWVYAEQQELVTEPNVPLRINLHSTDPAHRMVTLLTPADGVVQVTLQGSQIGIDKVKALLQQTLVNQPLDLEIGNAIPPGSRQTLPTLSQITSNPIFFRQGVTVTAAAPETLTLRVDALSDREVPVQAPPDVPGLEKAVFQPASVIMRGPTNLLDELARRNQLFAVADLSGLAALAQPGEHKKVPVTLKPQDNVTLMPTSVTADLTVGQADQSVEVSPVPVMVQAPKWLMDNYKFDYREVLPQPVTLVGPPAQIALVNTHAPKLIAVIELENDDAGKTEQKPVIFLNQGLPDGVRVRPDNVPVTVPISINPR
jgi:hypothetical protein